MVSNPMTKCGNFVCRLNKKLSPEAPKSTELKVTADLHLCLKIAGDHLHVNSHLTPEGRKQVTTDWLEDNIQNKQMNGATQYNT